MKKLQSKLVLNVLLTSTLPLAALAVITIVSLHRIAANEAAEGLKNRLNIARIIYQSLTDNLRHVVEGQNQRVCSLIETGRLYLLRKELAMLAVDQRLDFLLLTDAEGKVISSVSSPSIAGADFSKEPFVRKALEQKRSLVSTEIVTEAELRRLGLIRKVRIPGVGTEETKGLAIKAASPVINKDDAVIGAITGGYLLNNNNAIVDRITEATKFYTTIFLGKTRISTNLPYPLGRHALGLDIDAQAAVSALKNGKDYIERTRILTSWYLFAYGALYNYNRDIVGILGTAVPENTIFALRNEAALFFSFFVILSIILVFSIGILRAKPIVSQIGELHRGIEAFESGSYDYRVNIGSGDEIEELGDFYNKTMSQLRQARQRTIELGNEVDRTDEQLEVTRKQLLDNEKMVFMGKMATAVNHELKNIFAQIQTNISCLRKKEFRDISELSGSLKEVESGVKYASDSLDNLLKLSHPKRPISGEVDLNALIADLLSLKNLDGRINAQGIEVVRDFDPAAQKIKADVLQMKELFINLITNSIQAMPGGGKLRIATKMEKSSLRIEVSDTGCGISEHLLECVFQPFFTTKNKGMGLGLCIVKEIVEAHNGSIEFKTDSATYTIFIIRLPVTAAHKGFGSQEETRKKEKTA